MKKFYSLVVLTVVGVLLWRFALPIENFTKRIPNLINGFATSTVATEIQNFQDQVFAPPPLRSLAPKTSNPTLTGSGVIYWTNVNRNENGNLPALKENSKLDIAAQNKLKDLFAQQYFEHVNPQGKGPSDLAKGVGYAYISIGENLAEGYFKNNQDLLQAWMNSPGHRANILNTGFEEIGVAVGQGTFQGQQTWIAVQEFGRPQSSCPIVDSNLKSQLTSLQADINQLQPQLQNLKNQTDAMSPKTQADFDTYNALVAQYNAMVKIYNNKVDNLKLDTTQYNTEVNAYNTCLAN